MNQLHPSLEPALALLPPDLPVALFTRHSLRELAPNNGIPSYDLPLTPEGILLAEQWGARLDRPISAFYSSPVGRCIDTAQAMNRGAGLALPVEQNPLLVEPGCYVHSLRKIGPLFLQMGPVGFANHHLSRPLEGILSPREGARRLVSHLHDTQGAPGTLNVHVTHDTILAAFIYHLAGQGSISEADWPWMMEGAWLWFANDTLHWLWRGVRGQADLIDFLE